MRTYYEALALFVPNQTMQRQQFEEMRSEFPELCDSHFSMMVKLLPPEFPLARFLHMSDVVNLNVKNEMEFLFRLQDFQNKQKLDRAQVAEMCSFPQFVASNLSQNEYNLDEFERVWDQIELENKIWVS